MVIILCIFSYAYDHASKLLEACSICNRSYVPLYTHPPTSQANVHHKNTAKATPIPATATTPPAFSKSPGAAAVETLTGPLVVLEELVDPVPDALGLVELEDMVGNADALLALEAVFQLISFPFLHVEQGLITHNRACRSGRLSRNYYGYNSC